MYVDEVRELAYQLDSECWKSYSGKSKQVKRCVEARRKKALEQAQKNINLTTEHVDDENNK